jgi:MFS family permease
LIGSALLTLSLGVVANRFSRRGLLRSACLLMLGTGIAFAMATDYWPLLIVAFVGTINPTAGDVSPFLPLEHTVLTQSVEGRERTALFARYSLTGTLAGALGILVAVYAVNGFDVNWRPAYVSCLSSTTYCGRCVVPVSAAITGRRSTCDSQQRPLDLRRHVYRLMVLFSMTRLVQDSSFNRCSRYGCFSDLACAFLRPPQFCSGRACVLQFRF